MTKAVEDFALLQRAHHDKLLADTDKQLRDQCVDDDLRAELVAALRAELDADHERCVAEFSALVACGMRTTEPLH